MHRVLTLGMLSLLQIPSDRSRSRISQAKIDGHSRLYSAILVTTAGVATRGLEPPMALGLMDPVSQYLQRQKTLEREQRKAKHFVPSISTPRSQILAKCSQETRKRDQWSDEHGLLPGQDLRDASIGHLEYPRDVARTGPGVGKLHNLLASGVRQWSAVYIHSPQLINPAVAWKRHSKASHQGTPVRVRQLTL